MGLQGTGIWSGHLRYGDAAAIADAAAEVDGLGYTAVWIPDVGGDVLGSVELLLGATSNIGVATGILNIWMQDATDVAARRATWSEDWQHRFTLGLGASHAPLIDSGQPGRYTKPYSKMVEYLDGLDAAPEPFPNASFQTSSASRPTTAATAITWPTVLARPVMRPR